MTIQITTLDGKTAAIADDAVAQLGAGLRGCIACDGDADYDEARTIWNATVDRHPGLVVRALGASDVQQAVNFARDNGLVLSVRSGGHQIAGHAVAEGALLLDLSKMRSVRVDPATRSAWVEPGATLGDVDKETAAHGLALPVGINSTTGIAGLALGGGFGWITRKCGMTIDNLMSADVVTADGRRRRASATENPDLYWAIRGGGGNFGVITAFEFRLHEVGPQVLAGLIVHPYAEAPKLLREFRRIVATAPDELTIWTVFRKAPPLPFLPAEWHGKEVFVFAACYAGDIGEGEGAMAELRSLGKPIADVIGPTLFAGWQAAFDPLLTPGARNYWKSHDFIALSDEVIDILSGALKTSPGPDCEIFVAQVGGAMARVRADATAYPQRASHFIMNIHTRWNDAAQDAAHRRWAREMFDKLAPYAAGSVYVNFMPDDEVDRVSGAYGANMARLAAVKAQYDPKNLFRLNHNITPARMTQAAQ